LPHSSGRWGHGALDRGLVARGEGVPPVVRCRVPVVGGRDAVQRGGLAVGGCRVLLVTELVDVGTYAASVDGGLSAIGGGDVPVCAGTRPQRPEFN
jgi:hypothetical protein